MRLRTALLLVVVGLAATPVPAAEPLARNVIFILADDHRHDFLGFHPQAPDWQIGRASCRERV